MNYFRSSDFQSHVERLVSQHHVPGLSIAIIHDDVIASTSFGYASLSEPLKSCTPDTLFDIASCSKSLTAAAIALLVDDNENFPEVQYDAKLCNLFPEDDFVMPEESYTSCITVDDVLGHRTGMPGHNDSYMGVRASQPDNARSITRNLRNLSLAAPPRARYLYCNMMYTVATYLVELKTQQSFSDFLEQHFFTRLDMPSTSLQPSSARSKGLAERLATGHIWRKDRKRYECIPALESPESQGAGSIISSVNDFIKWVRTLLNRMEPINEKIYQGLTRMRSFVNPNPGAKSIKPQTSPRFYAAGLDIYWYRGYVIVGHNGTVSGFASHFIFMPECAFGAVILGNSSTATGVCTILMQQLIDDVLNVPDSERRHRNQMKGKVTSKGSARQQNQNAGQLNFEKLYHNDQPSQCEGNSIHGHAYMVSPQLDPIKLPPSRLNIRSEASAATDHLKIYTGEYIHPGYHSIQVQIKNGKLFVDATDRSNGFTLTFKAKSTSEDRDYDTDNQAIVKMTAQVRDWYEHAVDAELNNCLQSDRPENKDTPEVHQDIDDEIQAQFMFVNNRPADKVDVSTKPLRLGLRLEEMVEGYIWFERVEDAMQ